MITEQQIHYVKCSIRQFKEAPRIKVNMTLINREGVKRDYTWRLTQERREIYNSIEGAEDEGWPVYDEYVNIWRDIRRDQGHNAKMWIGKLAHRAKWSKGTQPLDRVPFAVGLLVLDRSTQNLKFVFQLEQFTQESVLQTIEGAQYNRVYTWQNPLTSVMGRRTRSAF